MDKSVEFSWTTSGAGLYVLHPEAGCSEMRDQLNARLAQLTAMLEMTCGGGRESFARWNDRLQDDYLWACAMLARECKELAENMPPNTSAVKPLEPQRPHNRKEEMARERVRTIVKKARVVSRKHTKPTDG